MHAPRPLPPETRTGRRAGWAALTAVLALLIANTLLADASGVLEAMRVASIVVFAASGVAALMLAVLSLTRGDRSIVVWASLVLGALATGLLVAEFTIME
jgi:hypothetical protein